MDAHRLYLLPIMILPLVVAGILHGPDPGRVEKPVPPTSAAPAITVSLHPTVTLDGETPEQRAKVEEALDTFRSHDMALPDLEITFTDERDDCRGHDGLFTRSASTPWSIMICADLGYVVAHELAHAWVAAWLDADDRVAYVDYRGLRTWGDTNTPWNERGTEDAAFMLQQVLMLPGDPATDRWAERFAAVDYLFELAYGSEQRL